MSIQIEEGKFYKRADGSVHGPAHRNDEAKWDDSSAGPYIFYPWNVGGQDYLNDGRFYFDQETHHNDLIAEISNGSLLTGLPVTDTHAVETVEGPQIADTPEWAKGVEAEAAADRDESVIGKIDGVLVHDIKTTIADEAKRIVSGARRSAYGKPEANFERIARFWDAYFKNTGRPEANVTANDISLLMVLMKIGRLAESPQHYDSWVDLIGYGLTGAEVNNVLPPTKSA